MQAHVGRILASLLCAVTATVVSVPQAIAEPTNIEGEIAQSARGSWHSVIVVMQEQNTATGLPATSAQEKTAQVNDLIDTAKTTQRTVLNTLAAAEKHHRARNIEQFYLVNAVAATVTREEALNLAKTPGVANVVVDQKIAAEPVTEDIGASLSGVKSSPAPKHVPWNLEQISVTENLQARYSGEGVTVGIIDSGVDISHPALAAKWRGNTGDKALSWFDAVAGSPAPVDSTGHGTHVLGTILGSDPNGASLLGVAPKAKFVAARVFDDRGETNDSRLLKAMQWMLAPVDSNGVAHAELAPRVVNNSWGTAATNNVLQDALKQWRKAGILPVFSAGNVDENTPGGPGSISQPASFPQAFAVGALRSDNRIAKFSLRGPSKFTNTPKPDIAAPGVNIRSSYRGHSLQILSGTSMAAPHVTGVAALVLGVNPALSVDQLESILRQSATALTDTQHVDSPNHAYGAGKVNAALAIDLATPKSQIGTVAGNVYVRGVDADAPVITHVPVGVFYQATTTDLSAKVSDDSGVDSVSLKITNAANQTRSQAMKLIEGTKVAGTYEVVISPKTLKQDDVSYQVCALDRTKKESCTQIQKFVQKPAVQVGWKEDFEHGTDGFEMGGKTPLWAWGEPAKSLKKPTSGDKLVAVGLDGNGYAGLSDSVLLTPPIAVDNAGKAALAFNHWYDLDNYHYAEYDTAEVWIGEVQASSGQVTWEEKPQRLFKNHSRDWERVYVNLSKYAGKTIRVMFGVRGAWKAKHTTPGWFIDDIAVEASHETKPQKITDDLAITKFPGGRTLIDFLPLKDKTVSAYRLYRAHNDGTFVKVQELTGTDIQKYTIAFNDTATPQQGTYSYYVTAVAGDAESDPSAILQRTYTLGKEIRAFNFESDDQGWTSQPDAKGNVFERGIPTLSDEKNNGRAPTSTQMAGKNPNSPNVFATVLNDYRKAKSTYTLTSPRLDLSAYSDVTMYWQQWFNTRGRKGFDDYSTYDDDIAHIYASSNGVDWEKIFTLDEKKIDEKDPGDHKTQLRVGNAWHLDSVKIPAKYLSNQTQIRFVLETGSELFDFSGGWYIDDVTFTDTAKATVPQPKLAGQAALAVYRGEEMPLPNVGKTHSVPASLDGNTTTDSWVPAPDATVELVDRAAKTVVEKGSGAYTLRARAGKTTVRAKAAGYQPHSVSVDLSDGKVTRQDFYLEKAVAQNVQFAVHNAGGQPVAAYHLTVYEKGSLNPLFTKEVTKNTVGPITANLLPGEYVARAGASGYLAADLLFSVKDGESNAITIKLGEASAGGQPKWIQYDSGSANSVPLLMTPGKVAAVRFDAEPNDHVNAVQLFVYKSNQEQVFEWALWDTNDLDGLPGRVLVGPTLQRVPAGQGGEWVQIPMPYPIPVHDTYYVSYKQPEDSAITRTGVRTQARSIRGALHALPAGQQTDRISLGIDPKTAGKDRSFKLINNAWDDPDETGQFLIRAQAVSITTAAPPGPVPGTPGAGPGTPGSVPSPSSPGSAPGSAGSAPGSAGSTPGAFKPAPKVPEAVPGSAGAVPKPSEAVPGSPGSAPGLGGSASGESGAVPSPAKPGSASGMAGSGSGSAGANTAPARSAVAAPAISPQNANVSPAALARTGVDTGTLLLISLVMMLLGASTVCICRKYN